MKSAGTRELVVYQNTTKQRDWLAKKNAVKKDCLDQNFCLFCFNYMYVLYLLAISDMFGC